MMQILIPGIGEIGKEVDILTTCTTFTERKGTWPMWNIAEMTTVREAKGGVGWN